MCSQNTGPLKPGGFCSNSNAVVGHAVTAIFVAAMFAARLTAAQQVVLKAGRPPRVYNALITSDQRLLPSQADPILTPVFRASPFQFFYGGGWPGATYTIGQSAVLSESAEPADVAADASSEIRNVDTEAKVTGEDDERQRSPPAVKNNRPVDAAVPDVPPPPLPVSSATARKKDRKIPEEYPPAPVGFAI